MVYLAAYLRALLLEGWPHRISARYATNMVRAYRRQRIERLGRI